MKITPFEPAHHGRQHRRLGRRKFANVFQHHPQDLKLRWRHPQSCNEVTGGVLELHQLRSPGLGSPTRPDLRPEPQDGTGEQVVSQNALADRAAQTTSALKYAFIDTRPRIFGRNQPAWIRLRRDALVPHKSRSPDASKPSYPRYFYIKEHTQHKQGRGKAFHGALVSLSRGRASWPGWL